MGMGNYKKSNFPTIEGVVNSGWGRISRKSVIHVQYVISFSMHNCNYSGKIRKISLLISIMGGYFEWIMNYLIYSPFIAFWSNILKVEIEHELDLTIKPYFFLTAVSTKIFSINTYLSTAVCIYQWLFICSYHHHQCL